MKKILLTIAAACLLVAACNNKPKEPSHDELISTIDSIEPTLMLATPLAQVDTALGNSMMSLYLKFADNYPEDSLTPYYLHHAAQLALSMDLIDEMVDCYDRVIDNYPDYEKLDECYYEKGIALDNSGRKEQARQAYQDFLETYPDHFLAEDIRKAIPLLDMSDELLLEFLNQNNK